jgi:hypothetical protein
MGIGHDTVLSFLLQKQVEPQKSDRNHKVEVSTVYVYNAKATPNCRIV